MAGVFFGLVFFCWPNSKNPKAILLPHTRFRVPCFRLILNPTKKWFPCFGNFLAIPTGPMFHHTPPTPQAGSGNINLPVRNKP